MNNEHAQELIRWLMIAPEAHDQYVWVEVPEDLVAVPVSQVMLEGTCGTRLCLAGAEVAGHAPPGTLFSSSDDESCFIPDAHGDWWLSREDGGMLDVPPSDSTVQMYRRQDIEAFAADSLDLEYGQVSWLFASDQTREALIFGLTYLQDHPEASEVDLHNAWVDEDEDED